jgi:hypothetical protein
MIENERVGHLNYGQMVNYSADGMCIGSDTFYNKGAAINVRFHTPPYKGAPLNYSGKVRWCKELVRDDFEFSYGVGIKFD